jgi:hypothetical protein
VRRVDRSKYTEHPSAGAKHPKRTKSGTNGGGTTTCGNRYTTLNHSVDLTSHLKSGINVWSINPKKMWLRQSAVSKAIFTVSPHQKMFHVIGYTSNRANARNTRRLSL